MTEVKTQAAKTVVIDRDEMAGKVVRNYMYWSMGAGLIPVPVLDIAVVTGVQLKMLSQVAKLYEVQFSEVRGKSIVSALLGSIVPSSLSKTWLGSLFKLVPVIGTYAGSVSMAIFSGAACYAIGKVFIQHFASGGTFLDFDPKKVGEKFAAEFEEGKAKAEEMKKAK